MPKRKIKVLVKTKSVRLTPSLIKMAEKLVKENVLKSKIEKLLDKFLNDILNGYLDKVYFNSRERCAKKIIALFKRKNK